MPIYVYQCESGHKWEEFRSMSKMLEVNCPHCISPVRIIPSLTSHRASHYFEHFAHDGTLLDRKQTTERAPEPGYKMDRSTGDFILNLSEV